MPPDSHPDPTAAYTALPARSFRSSSLTRGPWNPEHQHGGPPIALVCRELELAARDHGLTHVARLTANLLRPVPIADLVVEVNAEYIGRNAGHFSARLSSGNKEIGRFTALLQREEAVEVPAALPGHPLPTMAPSPEDSGPSRFPWAGKQVDYAHLVETRTARGAIFEEPSAIWFRMRHRLVEGEEPGGYQRVAVFADSGNGISAVLDFRKYVFINSDLTINLLRRPFGEWICVDARTLIGPSGCGLAESSLYDVNGLIGRATQSLSVRARQG